MSQPRLFLVLFLAVGMSSKLLSQSSDDSQVPHDVHAKDGEHADSSVLEFSRWSGDLVVPDPVAISFDNSGTAYITQTQRRKIQDLDIRANPDWVPGDVGLQSVQGKRDFYHQQLAPGFEQEVNRKRVQDLNLDGSHDWKDLTVVSEKIHWMQDRDADGTADNLGLFASGFQSEVTGIAAGILWHQGDVFATIAPDVWRLRDSDGDLQADSREIMATGFGLHIAYAGHDMHGLTVGPDGKIYWSIGDKGISVQSADGTRHHYPNQGGVMRCDPNGDNFEVYAHGLRNVQELAFDAYGNLFGVDNDSDQQDEMERFVYIVRDMDAGWRCNYQYRKDGYNPWTAERLWVPHFDGQASYILPAINNYVDGPAGFVFNPGTALSSEYLNHFFLTNAPRGYQYAFKVRERGATFAMEGSHLIGSGIPLVGLNFSPNGGLYGVDWGGGYPLNQSGAVWKIDVPDSDLAEQRIDVAKRLSTGFENLSVPVLSESLAHLDQRVRLGAQFELVKRNEYSTLVQSLSQTSQLAQIHAIWGLGQLARQGKELATDALIKTLSSKDAELRAQAIRTLTDVSNVNGRLFVPLLEDSSDRVRFMAAIALSKHSSADAVPKLLQISSALPESDRYLRFAVTRGLIGCASGSELADARTTSSKVGRLNLVVALRDNPDPHLLMPFLYDDEVDVAIESARALHDDFSDNQQLVALAESLPSTKLHDHDAYMLRALNANYRRGGLVELQRMIDFVQGNEHRLATRLEALRMIASWRTPDLLDRVDGRRRVLPQDRRVDEKRLRSLLSNLANNGEVAIQAGALRAARQVRVTLDSKSLHAIAMSTKMDAELRVEALRSLAEQETDNLGDILAEAIVDSQLKVRSAAAELLATHSPTHADEILVRVVRQADQLAEKQNALAQMSQLGGVESSKELVSLLRQISQNSLDPELVLDVLEASEKRAADDAEIEKVLAKANQAIEQIASKEADELWRFSVCRDGGDIAAGKKLFQSHLGAQCIRCHKVGKRGSDVGPNLAGLASKKGKDRTHLLRSLIAPSADIEKKYQTQTFLMFSGQVFQGVVKSESKDEIVIVNNQGKEVVLDNEEIEIVKKNQVSIMPDMKPVLTRMEIRDLVAYLSSLK